MGQYVAYFEKRMRHAHVTAQGTGPLTNLLMGIFLNGLANPNVRRELLVRQPTTLAEAFAAAMQLDVGRSVGTTPTAAHATTPFTAAGIRQQRNGHFNSRSSSSSSPNSAGATTRPLGVSSSNTRELPTKGPVCYGCNNPGHMLKDCPQRRSPRGPNAPGADINVVTDFQQDDSEVDRDALFRGYYEDLSTNDVCMLQEARVSVTSSFVDSLLEPLTPECTWPEVPFPKSIAFFASMDIKVGGSPLIRFNRVLVDSGAAVTVIDAKRTTRSLIFTPTHREPKPAAFCSGNRSQWRIFPLF